VLQVQYGGGKNVYSNASRLMDCQYMIKIIIKIDRKWHAMEGGVITKGRLAGKSTGPNPSHTQTDRSKSGTKCSILVVDGKGVPIGISLDGANRRDMM
jgi:hypothetical protein